MNGVAKVQKNTGFEKQSGKKTTNDAARHGCCS